MIKQQTRQKVRVLRKNMPYEQQLSAPSQVIQHFHQHHKIQAAQHIALFLSFDGELNTQPIIEYLWQQNKSVYLPVIHPFTHRNLLFLRYTPQTKLLKNNVGINQPKLDVRDVIPLSQLDVIITPLVAFDRHRNRLGMGGGYYDQILQYQSKYHFHPIGLAYDCQYIEIVPTESWDKPLPEIITPNQIW